MTLNRTTEFLEPSEKTPIKEKESRYVREPRKRRSRQDGHPVERMVHEQNNPFLQMC